MSKRIIICEADLTYCPAKPLIVGTGGRMQAIVTHYADVFAETVEEQPAEPQSATSEVSERVKTLSAKYATLLELINED